MPGSGKKMKSNGNNGSNGKAQQPLNFANRLIASIPTGRKGKHNVIVAKILADLDRLDMETAILVPLDGLNGEKMENVLHGRQILLRLAHGAEKGAAGDCSGQDGVAEHEAIVLTLRS
jgi:hypothetical protein